VYKIPVEGIKNNKLGIGLILLELYESVTWFCNIITQTKSKLTLICGVYDSIEDMLKCVCCY
jgi:hypothetical protein